MKKSFILFVLFATSILTVDAQMHTDNSYLRDNYSKSKTAQKAAEKKARKAEVKAIREAEKAAIMAEKEKLKEMRKHYKSSSSAKTSISSPTLLADAAYLAGALPQTNDGIVCFDHQFDIRNIGKTKAYALLKDYAKEIITKSQNLENSRIISESNDTLVASICEPMYFKRKKWESDSTIIRYRYQAVVNDNVASLRIWFISYCYEQSESAGFNYRAEEWITDKYALSKDGLTLLKVPGKFRRKTIDYVNEIFDAIETRIATLQTEAKNS